MKYLYKYPQARLSLRASWSRPAGAAAARTEYELLDTGVFDEDRYFDVFVEYAKAGPEDMLIRITVATAGPKPALAARAAHALVPQHLVPGGRTMPKPALGIEAAAGVTACIRAAHAGLGEASPPRVDPLAVHQERDQPLADVRTTRPEPLRQGRLRRLLDQAAAAGGQPGRTGTKAAARYQARSRPGSSYEGCACVLTCRSRAEVSGSAFAARVGVRGHLAPLRKAEADDFYVLVLWPETATEGRATLLSASR